VFRGDAQVVEYQVRQTSEGPDIDVRTSAELNTASLQQELEQRLDTLGVPSPTYASRWSKDRLASSVGSRRSTRSNPDRAATAYDPALDGHTIAGMSKLVVRCRRAAPRVRCCLFARDSDR